MRAVRLRVVVQLPQPGQEAGLVADLAGAVVVRVPACPIRQDDDARPQCRESWPPPSGAPPACSPGARRACAGSRARRAAGAGPPSAASSRRVSGDPARPHVARRQVQHARAVAHLGHLDQRAAAGLLDVVRMSRDGQHVDGGSHSDLLHQCSSRAPPVAVARPHHQDQEHAGHKAADVGEPRHPALREMRVTDGAEPAEATGRQTSRSG